jgi:hypothetical protein
LLLHYCTFGANERHRILDLDGIRVRLLHQTDIGQCQSQTQLLSAQLQLETDVSVRVRSMQTERRPSLGRSLWHIVATAVVVGCGSIGIGACAASKEGTKKAHGTTSCSSSTMCLIFGTRWVLT